MADLLFLMPRIDNTLTILMCSYCELKVQPTSINLGSCRVLGTVLDSRMLKQTRHSIQETLGKLSLRHLRYT